MSHRCVSVRYVTFEYIFEQLILLHTVLAEVHQRRYIYLKCSFNSEFMVFLTLTHELTDIPQFFLFQCSFSVDSYSCFVFVFVLVGDRVIWQGYSFAVLFLFVCFTAAFSCYSPEFMNNFLLVLLNIYIYFVCA